MSKQVVFPSQCRDRHREERKHRREEQKVDRRQFATTVPQRSGSESKEIKDLKEKMMKVKNAAKKGLAFVTKLEQDGYTFD